MKRDDIAIGHAALEAALGRLSESEIELVGDGEPPPARELAEAFLYHHLRIARDARLAMERYTEWSANYVAKYREREHALIAAAHHAVTLRAHGPLDRILAEMMRAEGLTP